MKKNYNLIHIKIIIITLITILINNNRIVRVPRTELLIIPTHINAYKKWAPFSLNFAVAVDLDRRRKKKPKIGLKTSPTDQEQIPI